MRRKFSIVGLYMAYYGFLGSIGAGACKSMGLDGWAAAGIIVGTLLIGVLFQYSMRIEFLGPEG